MRQVGPLFVLLLCAYGIRSSAQDLEQTFRRSLGDAFVVDPVDELSFQPEIAENARALIIKVVNEGWPTAPGARVQSPMALSQRLAARALWLGLCVEHEAMLVCSDEKKKRDYAWHAWAYAQKLRQFWKSHSMPQLDDSPDTQELWEQAMLKLDAFASEAEKVAGNSSVSSVSAVESEALQAYSCFSDDPDNPAELLMEKTSKPFRACQDLASKAISAKVQASLVPLVFAFTATLNTPT